MKPYILAIIVLTGFFGFSQDQDKEQLKKEKRATNLVYKANELAQEDDYIQAEMEYRRAISNAPNQAVGAYNLATTYYKKGNFNEALFRRQVNQHILAKRCLIFCSNGNNFPISDPTIINRLTEVVE